jgi:hypothetical protein
MVLQQSISVQKKAYQSKNTICFQSKNEKHTDSNILNQSIQYVLIILITIKSDTDSNILNYSIQYGSNILN